MMTNLKIHPCIVGSGGRGVLPKAGTFSGILSGIDQGIYSKMRLLVFLGFFFKICPGNAFGIFSIFLETPKGFIQKLRSGFHQ